MTQDCERSGVLNPKRYTPEELARLDEERKRRRERAEAGEHDATDCLICTHHGVPFCERCRQHHRADYVHPDEFACSRCKRVLLRKHETRLLKQEAFLASGRRVYERTGVCDDCRLLGWDESRVRDPFERRGGPVLHTGQRMGQARRDAERRRWQSRT